MGADELTGTDGARGVGLADHHDRRPRLRIGIGAGVVVVVVALASGVLFSALSPHGSTTTVTGPATVIGTEAAGDGSTAAAPVGGEQGTAPVVPGATASAIFVHILGEVSRPGLYEFAVGARGVDAVAAAGGFSKHADQSSLNLARVLTDGEQIVVPKRGKAPTAGAPTVPVAGALVNLNTADATALETLPGIGTALSGRIIAWRDTNGRFASIDDLGSVTGIGDKTLDALRDLVTV